MLQMDKLCEDLATLPATDLRFALRAHSIVQPIATPAFARDRTQMGGAILDIAGEQKTEIITEAPKRSARILPPPIPRAEFETSSNTSNNQSESNGEEEPHGAKRPFALALLQSTSHAPQHHAQVLQLLCKDRIADIDIVGRAILVCSIYSLSIHQHDELTGVHARSIADILFATTSADLTVLKV
jgi:hypothetical protein